MRAPFSATERFISSTTGTSASVKAAKIQKLTKLASAEACCWRRFSTPCQARCCKATGSAVWWRKNLGLPDERLRGRVKATLEVSIPGRPHGEYEGPALPDSAKSRMIFFALPT
jgi:hypothetical protein